MAPECSQFWISDGGSGGKASVGKNWGVAGESVEPNLVALVEQVFQVQQEEGW